MKEGKQQYAAAGKVSAEVTDIKQSNIEFMKRPLLPPAGLFVVLFFCFFNSNTAAGQKKEQLVRISEIEIVPEYLQQYKAILQEESEASVRLEPGVIVIFPMFQKENPNQLRILEIYADKEAYQSHLKTPHFLLYKTSTLKMVKTLKLVDMNPLDAEAMPGMFTKYK